MITKNFAFAVWSNLDQGNSIKQTADLLLQPDTSMIERLSAELNGFRVGYDDKMISKKVGWTPDTIAIHRHWWNEYERSLHPWPIKQHYDELTNAAAKFRSRMINPEVGMEAFNNPSIWYWGGYDWRLSPDIWFSVVCPFIDFGKDWIDNFENLLTHLSGSDFFKHYEELRENTLILQRELNDCAESLRKQHPSFGEQWDKFNDTLEIAFVDNHNPKEIPTEEDISYLEDKQFCSDWMKYFEGMIPGLESKYDALKNQLQRLWDEFNPDAINSIIEAGKCDRCSPSLKPKDS